MRCISVEFVITPGVPVLERRIGPLGQGSTERNLLIQERLSENGVSVSANKFVVMMDDLEYNTIDELKIPDEVISSAVDSADTGLFDNALGK